MNTGEQAEFIFPSLKEQRDLRILDIGCGEGNLLSNIYNLNTQRIKYMVGVDNANEEDLDSFENGFVDAHNNTIGNVPMANGLADFHRQDGFEYLQNLTVSFDLIIFSNVFHFYTWDEVSRNLKIVANLLSPNGIIYIQVANEAKKFKSPLKTYPFTNEIIDEIRSFLTIKRLKETSTHYYLILAAP